MDFFYFFSFFLFFVFFFFSLLAPIQSKWLFVIIFFLLFVNYLSSFDFAFFSFFFVPARFLLHHFVGKREENVEGQEEKHNKRAEEENEEEGCRDEERPSREAGWFLDGQQKGKDVADQQNHRIERRDSTRQGIRGLLQSVDRRSTVDARKSTVGGRGEGRERRNFCREKNFVWNGKKGTGPVR